MRQAVFLLLGLFALTASRPYKDDVVALKKLLLQALKEKASDLQVKTRNQTAPNPSQYASAGKHQEVPSKDSITTELPLHNDGEFKPLSPTNHTVDVETDSLEIIDSSKEAQGTDAPKTPGKPFAPQKYDRLVDVEIDSFEIMDSTDKKGEKHIPIDVETDSFEIMDSKDGKGEKNSPIDVETDSFEIIDSMEGRMGDQNLPLDVELEDFEKINRGNEKQTHQHAFMVDIDDEQMEPIPPRKQVIIDIDSQQLGRTRTDHKDDNDETSEEEESSNSRQGHSREGVISKESSLEEIHQSHLDKSNHDDDSREHEVMEIIPGDNGIMAHAADEPQAEGQGGGLFGRGPDIPITVVSFVMASPIMKAEPLHAKDLTVTLEQYSVVLDHVKSILRKLAAQLREQMDIPVLSRILGEEFGAIGKVLLPSQRDVCAAFFRIFIYGLEDRPVCDLKSENSIDCVASRVNRLARIFSTPDHMDSSVDKMRRCKSFTTHPGGGRLALADDLDCTASELLRARELLTELKNTMSEIQLAAMLDRQPLPKTHLDIEGVEDQIIGQLQEEFRALMTLTFRIMLDAGQTASALQFLKEQPSNLS